jgi:hypothetical protein
MDQKEVYGSNLGQGVVNTLFASFGDMFNTISIEKFREIPAVKVLIDFV